MVSAFSSLINGGYYYQPHVVKQIQDENGNVIETNDPTLLRKTVSKQTSDRVKEALRAVMTDGTGVPANVEDTTLAEKPEQRRSFREGMETICFLLLDMHHRKIRKL